MHKLAFLLLFASLLGCGRGQSDLYRAYNVSPMHDGSTGKVTEDLATQNRNSLQTGVEYSYLYMAPEQSESEDKSKSDKSDKSDKTADDSESATNQTADDSAIPDDVAGDKQQAIADKIDDLKQVVSDLNKK